MTEGEWAGLFDPDEAIGDQHVLMLQVRDRGKCAWCGEPFGADLQTEPDIHHRKLRSREGRNGLANLIRVCHAEHMGLHNDLAEIGAKRGFLVSRYADEREVPLVLHSGFEVLLSDEYPDYEATGKWIDTRTL